MSELWSDLLTCLKLEPVAPVESSTAAAFEGRNQRLEYHRVFGGQILGQFVRAAELTRPGKAVKSLHALFPREGRAEESLRYDVTVHHEGRTFATLAVVASQSSGVVATASVSMHAPEDGPAHQWTGSVGAVPTDDHTVAVELLPWEVRTRTDLNSTDTGSPEFEMWIRTPEVDPALAPALAGYATDLTLIGTALRPMEGISQVGNGTAFLSAVTCHNLWFHRPFRTDDWLLLRQHSPVLAHGRCFGRGDVFTADGTLVASYAQEALVRLP